MTHIPDDVRRAGWDAFQAAIEGGYDSPQVYAQTLEAITAAFTAGRVVLDLPEVEHEDDDGDRGFYVDTNSGRVEASLGRGGDGVQPPWFRVNNGKWLQVRGGREFAAAIVAVVHAAESSVVGGDPQ